MEDLAASSSGKRTRLNLVHHFSTIENSQCFFQSQQQQQQQQQSYPVLIHEAVHDNLIVRLLEADRIAEAYQRCITHPQECIPIPILIKRESDACKKEDGDDEHEGSQDVNVLFEATPLGIACRKFHLKHDASANASASFRGPKRNFICTSYQNIRNGMIASASPQRIGIGEDNNIYIGCPFPQQSATPTQIQLIRALYNACPQQIRCSQMKKGRTPLLDAVSNPNATLELRKFIIDADCKYTYDESISFSKSTLPACKSGNDFEEQSQHNYHLSECFAMKTGDSNGLLPLHHLINQVRRNAMITSENKTTIESIRYMIQRCPDLVEVRKDAERNENDPNSIPSTFKSPGKGMFSRGVEISPLIHLLSQKVGTRHQGDTFMKPIIDCAEILLGANSFLVQSKSVMSRCTPLHMALRNGYDENDALITLLLKHDTHGYQIRERNIFGDLAIHVAASIGVKERIFKILLNHILSVAKWTKELQQNINVLEPIDVPSPYIWSMNKAGYTPIHLMWMRHFHRNKIQYPISTRSLGRVEKRGIYHEALESAVGELLNRVAAEEVIENEDIHQIATEILGSFWNYLLLYLRACKISQSIHRREPKFDGDGFKFLHSVCALACPMLPRPILDLALNVFPHHINELDEDGRNPLHYACVSYLALERTYMGLPAINDGWKENDSELPITHNKFSTLGEIIELNPIGVSISDNYGLLPLNYAIENEKCLIKMTRKFKGFQEWCVRRSGGHCVLNCNKALEKLIKANPDGLEWRDPTNHFLPFIQCAAESEGNSTASIYNLLRISPGEISSSINNDTAVAMELS